MPRAALLTWKPANQPMHRAALVFCAGPDTTPVVLMQCADYDAEDAAHDARRYTANELEAEGRSEDAAAVWDTEPLAVGAEFNPATVTTAAQLLELSEEARQVARDCGGKWWL